ncbi:MAG: PD40 domain-containing protein [Bacteroidales bacterium]|nr:PD40 domain-containing protein [Bacteroidales bacterium]
MRKYIFLLLIGFSVISCKKEDNGESDNTYFWSPAIKIEKGDKEVKLYLSDPRPYTEYLIPPSDPDYFEIYYSDDLSSFSLFKKVDITTTSVSINNLVNNEPYYIYVTSNKKNFEPGFSDTLMTIPSAYTEPVVLSPDVNFTLNRVDLSPDKDYFSFVSYNCPVQNTSTDNLYYKSITTGSIGVIEEDVYNSDWSPVSNTVTYLSNIRVGNWIYPDELKTFDLATKTGNVLLKIDYDKYYVSSPVFSNNGNLISYLSSENSSSKYNYDLWTIDPATKVRTKISNFEAIGLTISGTYTWSSNGEYIYLSGYFNSGNSRNAIYKFNVSSRELSRVLSSDWSDSSPSVSPDNTKIAFISTRTGDSEIWLYNTVSAKYSQITGNSAYNFDSRYSNVQWIGNNELLITAYKDSTSKALRIHIE